MSDQTAEIMEAFAPVMGATMDAQVKMAKAAIAGDVAAAILGAQVGRGMRIGRDEAVEAARLGYAAATEILRLGRGEGQG